jgi:hypothetical protein
MAKGQPVTTIDVLEAEEPVGDGVPDVNLDPRPRPVERLSVDVPDRRSPGKAAPGRRER